LREILAAVSRHVALDPDKVIVRMERGKDISTLEVDIELPNGLEPALAGRGLISPNTCLAAKMNASLMEAIFRVDGANVVTSPHAAGPWDPNMQHGGGALGTRRVGGRSRSQRRRRCGLRASPSI
jgi:hypothetical protein